MKDGVYIFLRNTIMGVIKNIRRSPMLGRKSAKIVFPDTALNACLIIPRYKYFEISIYENLKFTTQFYIKRYLIVILFFTLMFGDKIIPINILQLLIFKRSVAPNTI